jgi:hypothetical protein
MEASGSTSVLLWASQRSLPRITATEPDGRGNNIAPVTVLSVNEDLIAGDYQKATERGNSELLYFGATWARNVLLRVSGRVWPFPLWRYSVLPALSPV